MELKALIKYEKKFSNNIQIKTSKKKIIKSILEKRRSGNKINSDIAIKIVEDVKKNKQKALLKYEKKFIKDCGKKIINIHPWLLPKYKGLNTFERVIKNNEKKTGCTVHFVNEKLDSGKLIIQKSFFINKNDKANILKINLKKWGYWLEILFINLLDIHGVMMLG